MKIKFTQHLHARRHKVHGSLRAKKVASKNTSNIVSWPNILYFKIVTNKKRESNFASIGDIEKEGT